MSNETISKVLTTARPSAIGKIGYSEMRVLHSFLYGNLLSQQDLHDIFVVAGLFPPNRNSLLEFNELMLSCLPEVDVLAQMKIDEVKEQKVIDSLAPSSNNVSLRDLEPYYWDAPWSSKLSNKNVLVMSPFTETITKQFELRKELWESDVLPDMNLSCIKTPLSHYLSNSKFESWNLCLDHLKNEMRKHTFDVCLIGAGAWSIPLAVEAKRMGKIGIHLGGPLQILFGIKGGRWDNHEIISKMYNDHWVRPSSNESPGNNRIVEGGCYW